jgi:hypothetical protein
LASAAAANIGHPSDGSKEGVATMIAMQSAK